MLLLISVDQTASSSVASGGGRPPEYLSVPGFKDCVTETDAPGGKFHEFTLLETQKLDILFYYLIYALIINK